MEQVKKGDLLFHGDTATAKQMNVILSTTAMACAMCHPFASDTHPHAFPSNQVSMNKFRDASRHDQLVLSRNPPRREDRF